MAGSRAEVFIPFCGFYESWIDGLIDDEIEQQFEETDLDEITPENYKVDFEAIARAYVDLYEETLENKMAEEGLLKDSPRLFFKELISPREYNFETDRILVEVDDRWKLWTVRKALMGGSGSLQHDIDEKFRSRSGFASFYDDFADNWRNKPLDEWDCNELSVLLPHFDMEDFEDPELTTFREAIMDAAGVTFPESDPAPTA